MKKLLPYLLCSILTILLWQPSSAVAPEYLFDGQFNLVFEDRVTIRIGAAIEDKTRNELHTGSSVGHVQIDPNTFKKMEEATSQRFRIQIEKTGIGNLRNIYVTYLDQNNKRIKGLYNVKDRGFLFGNLEGQSSNNNCGSVGIGIVKGYIAPDMKGILNGEFGMGFIAGCNPILISASATFYYKGNKTAGLKPDITAKPTIKPGLNNIKPTTPKPVSAAKIEGRLTAHRWKPVFYQKDGNKHQLKPNDFLEMRADKNYDVVLLNLHDKGTWKYDASVHAIIYKNTEVYVITELTDSTLKMVNNQTEWDLVAKKTNLTTGTASSNTKLIVAKKWKVAQHRKGLLKISYKPNDYILFNEDGTYEHVLFNIYCSGTWKWTEGESKITVNCNGSNTWTIKTLSSDKMYVTKWRDEHLTLVPKS